MNLDAVKEIFLAESEELLLTMEDSLLRLEKEPESADDINSLFRAVHTIKGSSGMFGFEQTVAFTHHVENWLDDLRSGEVQLGTGKISSLLKSKDHIVELIDIEARKAQTVSGDLIDKGQELVAELTGENLGSGAASSGGENIVSSKSNIKKFIIEISLTPKILQHGLDPLSFIKYLGGQGEIVLVRVNHDSLDIAQYDPELCYISFYIEFMGVLSELQIADVFEFMASESQISIKEDTTYQASQPNLGGTAVSDVSKGEAAKKVETTVNETRAGEVSKPLEKADLAPVAQEAHKKFIRIEAFKLDKLINLVGELVISGATISQQAEHHKLPDIAESSGSMIRLIEDLRDNVMSVRMVQIGDTFRRFERMVRDISQDLGKKVRMQVKGVDTELDKNIIENISDPLLHLIRNSLDHGIETPDERKAAGKNEEATIRLSAYHDTGSIVLEVIDDGRGLNKDKILKKAIDSGLVSANTQLTDESIYYLIFEPGLSTAQSVTNISGRGVGMDVVRRNIENLRGRIDLETTPGVGTTFRIRLPLTLAIIDGFLVSVRDNFFVIPLDMVIECVEHNVAHLSTGGDFINLRGDILSFLRLDKFFNEKSEPPEKQSLIVVKNGRSKAGLVVDTLEGESQTVIKPLGRLFDHLNGISGSTIMGSGEVALILDVPKLIDAAVASATY